MGKLSTWETPFEVDNLFVGTKRCQKCKKTKEIIVSFPVGSAICRQCGRGRKKLRNGVVVVKRKESHGSS